MKLSLIFVGSMAVVAGCAAPAGEADALGTSEAAIGEAGTLTFGADSQVRLTGTLQKGKKVRVAYDAERLSACRGDIGGKPGWAITGYWKIDGGEIHSFEAGGLSPSNGTQPPVFELDQAGDLQIWFQNNSRWGCNAYDSDFGKNYHFAVKPAADEPGWVGNVRSLISRRTCDGPCDFEMREVNGEVLYEGYARQRAAIRAIFFEAWKEGVTDFDNAHLWMQLDVQVHRRVGPSAAFTTAYVNFDRRTGNNARYAVDLTAIDPIPGRFTIEKASDCPPFPISVSPDGNGTLVEATVEMYFTVNGVELRPAPGAAYRVRYQNYRALYAPCIQ